MSKDTSLAVIAYSRWVIRWRWLIVIGTLLLVVLAASGARFIEFAGSYRAYFSDDNPQLKAYDELQNTYSKNDNVMFVIAPKELNCVAPVARISSQNPPAVKRGDTASAASAHKAA